MVAQPKVVLVFVFVVDEGKKRQARNCLSNTHKSCNGFMLGIVYGHHPKALSMAPTILSPTRGGRNSKGQ